MKIAADRGHTTSQTMVGDYYFEGSYIRLNYQEALRYYKMAAEKGDEEALYQLGRVGS